MPCIRFFNLRTAIHIGTNSVAESSVWPCHLLSQYLLGTCTCDIVKRNLSGQKHAAEKLHVMALLRQMAKVLPAQMTWGLNPSAAVFTRGVKSHTGIAGLDVDPNARETLRSHLENVLQAIKIVPEDTEYRRNVEATMNDKLSFVNSEMADEEVEDKLDAQLEQYIKFTQDELSLIPKMAGRRMNQFLDKWHLHSVVTILTCNSYALQNGHPGRYQLVTR